MKPFSLVFLLLVSLPFLSVSSKRKADWNELKSVKMYDTEIQSTDDSHLDTLNFVELNLPRTKEIFGKAKRSKNRLFLWKGHHSAVAAFNNGEKIALKISTYGGFFMEMKNGGIYEFKNAMDKKEWDIFLHSVYHELYSN